VGVQVLEARFADTPGQTLQDFLRQVAGSGKAGEGGGATG
jgi:hypothetical protein